MRPEKAGAVGLMLGLVVGLVVGYALFHRAVAPQPTAAKAVVAARPDAPHPDRRAPDAQAVPEDQEGQFDPDKAAQQLEDKQADDQDADVTVTGVREVESD
jgi:hypothetical protein